MDFKNKYLKYKNKYLQLKKQLGGIYHGYDGPIFRNIGVHVQPNLLILDDPAHYTMKNYDPINPNENSYIPVRHPDNGILLKYKNNLLVNHVFIQYLLKSTLYDIRLNHQEYQDFLRKLETFKNVYIIDFLNVCGRIDRDIQIAKKTFFSNIITHNIKSNFTNLYIVCGRTNGFLENTLNQELRVKYTDEHGQVAGPDDTLRGLHSNILVFEFRINVPDHLKHVSVNPEEAPSAAGYVAGVEGSLDDFLFWTMAISFNNLLLEEYERTNVNIFNPINDISVSFSPDLLLITNDKQKINDPPRPPDRRYAKNLYSELHFLRENNISYRLEINGMINNYLTDFIINIDSFITDPANQHNEPGDYGRMHPIGFDIANECLPNTLTPNAHINIEHVSRNINIHYQNSDIKCTNFQKFMTLIKYLQNVYFNCDHDTQNHDNTCSLRQEKIIDFINGFL